MKVAMLVGMLMFNVIAGLYESGWVDGAASPDSDAGLVQALDTEPPPPSWP
jgi:hypothetical protein